MAKFTPGPWGITPDWIEDEKVNQDLITSTEEAGIALVYTGGTDVHHRNDGPANARLIAAAPEMYDLLRLHVERRIFSDPREMLTANDKARALLARIDGDSDE